MDILFKRLNALGNYIYTLYPSINYGGCGIYAVAIAKELIKLHIKPKILVVSQETYTDMNVRDVAKTIEHTDDVHEWNDKGIIFRHVIISFTFEGQEYHYDTGGVVEADEKYEGYHIYKGHLQLHEAKAIIKHQAGWNTTFDRNKIPFITQHIENFLEPRRWCTEEWLAKRKDELTIRQLHKEE